MATEKQTEFLRAHSHAYAVASSSDADYEDYEDALETAFEVDATLTGFSHIRSMIWLLQGRYHWGSEHISAYLAYLRRRFQEEEERCGVSVAPEALELDMKDLRQWTLPGEHRAVYATIVMYRDFAESCVEQLKQRGSASAASSASACAALLFVKTADEFLKTVRSDWEVSGEEDEEHIFPSPGRRHNSSRSGRPRQGGGAEGDEDDEYEKRKAFRDYVIHPELAERIGIDERFQEMMKGVSKGPEIVFSQEVYRPLWKVVEHYYAFSPSDEKEETNAVILFLRAYLGTHVARECTSIVDGLETAVNTVRNLHDEFVRTADGTERADIVRGGGGSEKEGVLDGVIMDALFEFRERYRLLTGEEPFETSFVDILQKRASASSAPEPDKAVVKVPGKGEGRMDRRFENVKNILRNTPVAKKSMRRDLYKYSETTDGTNKKKEGSYENIKNNLIYHLRTDGDLTSLGIDANAVAETIINLSNIYKDNALLKLLHSDTDRASNIIVEVLKPKNAKNVWRTQSPNFNWEEMNQKADTYLNEQSVTFRTRGGGGGSWFKVSPVSATLARASRFGDDEGGASPDVLRRKTRDLSGTCKTTVESLEERWKTLKPRLLGWSSLTTDEDTSNEVNAAVDEVSRTVEALLHTAKLGHVDEKEEEEKKKEKGTKRPKQDEAKQRFLEGKRKSSVANATAEEKEEEDEDGTLKGGHASPVIMGVFASDIGLLLLFKVLRAVIQVVTLFAAQKVFQETYVRKVHVEKVDPPPLWNMLLIYLSFDATLQIILMMVTITASYALGRGPGGTIRIDDMFLKLVLVDFLGTTLVTLVLGVMLAHIIRRKRFFMYKRSGMNTSSAYRDILALLIGVTFFIPFGILLT